MRTELRATSQLKASSAHVKPRKSTTPERRRVATLKQPMERCSYPLRRPDFATVLASTAARCALLPCSSAQLQLAPLYTLIGSHGGRRTAMRWARLGCQGWCARILV